LGKYHTGHTLLNTNPGTRTAGPGPPAPAAGISVTNASAPPGGDDCTAFAVGKVEDAVAPATNASAAVSTAIPKPMSSALPPR
jgi:hypothetical protein